MSIFCCGAWAEAGVQAQPDPNRFANRVMVSLRDRGIKLQDPVIMRKALIDMEKMQPHSTPAFRNEELFKKASARLKEVSKIYERSYIPLCYEIGNTCASLSKQSQLHRIRPEMAFDFEQNQALLSQKLKDPLLQSQRAQTLLNSLKKRLEKVSDHIKKEHQGAWEILVSEYKQEEDKIRFHGGSGDSAFHFSLEAVGNDVVGRVSIADPTHKEGLSLFGLNPNALLFIINHELGHGKLNHCQTSTYTPCADRKLEAAADMHAAQYGKKSCLGGIGFATLLWCFNPLSFKKSKAVHAAGTHPLPSARLILAASCARKIWDLSLQDCYQEVDEAYAFVREMRKTWRRDDSEGFEEHDESSIDHIKKIIAAVYEEDYIPE